MRNQDEFEVDPVGVDAVVDTFVRLNPIAIDIAGDLASPYRSCHQYRSLERPPPTGFPRRRGALSTTIDDEA
jgi:hypothetical protein